MRPNLRSVCAVFPLALGLWIMPSLGTQGMGTLNGPFNHVDRTLMANDAIPSHPGAAPIDSVQKALLRVDRTVEAALRE